MIPTKSAYNAHNGQIEAYLCQPGWSAGRSFDSNLLIFAVNFPYGSSKKQPFNAYGNYRPVSFYQCCSHFVCRVCVTHREKEKDIHNLER